jgi:hypothetical protein
MKKAPARVMQTGRFDRIEDGAIPAVSRMA